MKVRFNLLAHGYSRDSDKIIDNLGTLVCHSGAGEKLHAGDIVLLIDGKEAIVTQDGIHTRKMIAGGSHVEKIVKKFNSLEVGDTYLKGLVEVI
ncbi:hypothetical protein P4639_22095 [Priestia megaterium]|uniref:hypothetical protein n=1 Tax=Priestia megaterium TaxID=1404 RepID=UPI002E24628A|nr:hypothetical protein [Priestia megaterium]